MIIYIFSSKKSTQFLECEVHFKLCQALFLMDSVLIYMASVLTGIVDRNWAEDHGSYGKCYLYRFVAIRADYSLLR